LPRHAQAFGLQPFDDHRVQSRGGTRTSVPWPMRLLNSHESSVRVARRRRSLRRFSAGLDELEPRFLLATDVLMYHDGPTSTGSNPGETQLTPSNVSSSSFGKLFQVPVDGQVYAQPLVATGVNITTGASPGIHDVVFVATENDSLYAIDADSAGGQVLWQRSFLTSGLPGATSIAPVPIADVGGSISPEVGITGTPLIDKATNTLYLVAKTKETVGGVAHYVQRIYAVNMSDGTNQVAPFLIGDTTGANTNDTPVYVYGSGDGSVIDSYNGTGEPVVQFNALRENERVALSLVGGVVYAGWASPGDISPYHGWLIGFDAATLALKGVFNTTPNGGLGGIWQSGGSVSTDGAYLYLQVGNGTFDGNNGATGNVTTAPGPVTGLDASGFPVDGDYGDSFLKVGLDPASTPTHQNLNGWGLKVVDYFTPTNQYDLQAADLDVGSGAPMLLPPGVGSVAHPDLLVGGSKDGTIYLIDRDKMGKFGTTDHVVQEVTGQFTGVFATAAYGGGLIYVVGPGGPAKAFSIADGAMSRAPVSQSSDSYAYAGSTPSISSNGSLGGINGIVWDIDRGTNELRAYSSDSYGTELYNSNQAPNGRDTLGPAVTFGVSTVANGRVFVGTAEDSSNSDLVAYGIIAPPVAAPAAPTDLAASALDASQVKLTWTDHDVAPNWADYFSVEMSTDGIHFTPVANLSAGTAAFTMTGLSPGTTYDFRVRAINNQGDSGYTNVAGATPTPVPQLEFAVSTLSVNENAGTAQIQIVRLANEHGAVSVHVATSGGSAVAGVNYTPIDTTLNFADGQASQTLTIPIRDDGVVTGDLSLNLVLSAPGGGALLGSPSSATLIIHNTDLPPLVTMLSVQPVTNRKHLVTRIIVLFSGDLNAGEATSPAIYRLATAGKKGSFTAKNSRVIKLKSAVYNPANDSVTLAPRTPFALTKPVQLQVNGGVLEDRWGRLIDGNDDGQPGGNAVAVLKRTGVAIVA
jgi:hypothetical protein